MVFVKVLYGYDPSTEQGALTLNVGDILEVYSILASGWADGCKIVPIDTTGQRGWFPSNYVKEITETEVSWHLEQAEGVILQRPSVNGNRPSADSSAGTSDIWAQLARKSSTDSFEASSFSQGADIFAELAAASTSYSTSSASDSSPAQAPRSANQTNKGIPTQQRQSWDFWEPQLSEDGQIYYVNARTGQTSTDPPDEGFSNGHATLSDKVSEAQNRHVSEQSLMKDFHSNLHRDQSMKRPDLQRQQSNGILPEGWIAKLADDGRSTIYQNIRTRETRWSVPASVQLSSRSSSQSSADLSTQIKSLDNLAQRLQGADLNAARSETSLEALQPNPPLKPSSSSYSFHRSSLSFDSDDSATDANVTISSTRKGKGPEIVVSESRERGRLNRPRLPANLEELQGTIPDLAQLTLDAKEAVNRLVTFVRPLSDHVDSEFDRHQLARLAAALISCVKLLLGTVHMLDPSLRVVATGKHTRTSSSASLQLLEAQVNQLRPIVKKITSPLNKLILSTRALWGTMWTSPEDEIAAQEDLLLLELDLEDMETIKNNQLETFKVRQESEIQLRHDICNKAEEAGRAMTGLGEFIAAAPTANLKKFHASFIFDASSSLGPGFGCGGSWKSNGFELLPLHSTSRLAQSPWPIPEYRYPSQLLTAQTLSSLSSVQSNLTEEIANLRGAIAGLVAQSNKRASIMSNSSYASETSNAATAVSDGGNAQTSAAVKHLPKILNQAAVLADQISSLMESIENLDLASQIDLEVDSSDFQSLLQFHQRFEQNQPKSDQSDHAQQQLANLSRCKQIFYDLHADLLLAVQSIALVETYEQAASKDYLKAVPQAQPYFAAPLSDFQVPSIFPDALTRLLTCLGPAENYANELFTCLGHINQIIEQQSQAPRDRQEAGERARSRISNQRLSQLSFASSNGFQDQDDTASEKGTVTNISRSSQDYNGSLTMSTISDTDTEENFFYSQMAHPALSSFSDQSAVDSTRMATPASGISHKHNDSYGLGLQNGDEVLAGTLDADEEDDILARSSPVNRSPSTSKLKKFFGDDAPPAGFALRKQQQTIAEELPEFLQGDFNEEISLTIEGQIKGGTLRALIARLTSHELVDSAYNSALLTTYRTFTTPLDFVNLLLDRYNTPPPLNLSADEFRVWTDRKQKLIRIRTINVIKTWLETYFVDREAETVLTTIERFAMKGLGDSTASQQLLRVVERRRMNGIPRRMSAAGISTAPSAIVPRRLGRLRLIDIDPLEMARQLTIMNGRYFQRIGPDECLSRAWPDLLSHDTLPNIPAMIAFDNATTQWVTISILSSEDLKKRANIIKHFINIAEKCLKLQNFSTLMHIIAALESTHIRRLRRTWDLVNPRSLQTFHGLADLMSTSKQCAKYREALRTIGPPCVPFLGIFLTSWTFIGEGMPDFLKEQPSQINFVKRRKAAELLQQIELHQSAVYNLLPVKSIIDFIENAFSTNKNDDELWEMSLAIEPREREDEKIARLLSESGFLTTLRRHFTRCAVQNGIGTKPPQSDAFHKKTFKSDKPSNNTKQFDQDPSESNVTISDSAPTATQEYVEGLPDPISDPNAYQKSGHDKASSSFVRSSSQSSPSHEGLANEMKSNKQNEKLGTSTEGFSKSLPPDFNTQRQREGPSSKTGPWTKQDVKKRT